MPSVQDDFNYLSKEVQGWHFEKNEDGKLSNHLGYTHIRCPHCGRVSIVAKVYMAACPKKKITCGREECQ